MYVERAFCLNLLGAVPLGRGVDAVEKLELVLAIIKLAAAVLTLLQTLAELLRLILRS